jgi:hypothetical protein
MRLRIALVVAIVGLTGCASGGQSVATSATPSGATSTPLVVRTTRETFRPDGLIFLDPPDAAHRTPPHTADEAIGAARAVGDVDANSANPKVEYGTFTNLVESAPTNNPFANPFPAFVVTYDNVPCSRSGPAWVGEGSSSSSAPSATAQSYVCRDTIIVRASDLKVLNLYQAGRPG